MENHVVNSMESADKKFVLTEYNRSQSGGHAPYGKTLILSPTYIGNTPGKEHVIFAGYCDKVFEYRWNSNKTISVTCTSSSKNAINTLSLKAYNKEVNLSLKTINQKLKEQGLIQAE